MINKILVAYDDGMQAAKALDMAIEIAKCMSSEIYICSVYSIPTNDWERFANMSGVTLDSSTVTSFEEHNRKYIENFQVQAAEKVRQANIPVNTIIMEGKPGSVLTTLAEDLNIDMIILGSHNRGAVGRLFLGSVSNYVLHNAKCQVLVVKD